MQSLRQSRTRQLISIRVFATLAQVTPKTLTDLEYGRRRASYVTMRRISAALGVAPEEITEFAAVLAARSNLRDDRQPDACQDSIA